MPLFQAQVAFRQIKKVGVIDIYNSIFASPLEIATIYYFMLMLLRSLLEVEVVHSRQ